MPDQISPLPSGAISEKPTALSPLDLLKQLAVSLKGFGANSAPQPASDSGAAARIGGPPPSIMNSPLPQGGMAAAGIGLPGRQGPMEGGGIQPPGGMSTGFNFPTKGARNAAIAEGAIQNIGQSVMAMKQQSFDKKKQQAAGLTAQIIAAQQILNDPSASPEAKKLAQQTMQQIYQGKNAQKTSKMLEKMQDPNSAEYAGMVVAYQQAKQSALQNQQAEVQQAQMSAILAGLKSGKLRIGDGGKLESTEPSADAKLGAQTSKDVEAMREKAESDRLKAQQAGQIRDEKTGAVPSLDYNDGTKWQTYGYKPDMSMYPKDVAAKLKADHDNWIASQNELDKRESKREDAAASREDRRLQAQQDKQFIAITKPARAVFDLYKTADKAAQSQDDFALATAYLQATTGSSSSRGASSKMLDEAVASGRSRFSDIALKVRKGGVSLTPDQRNGMVDEVKAIYEQKRVTSISNLKDEHIYREPDNLPDFGVQAQAQGGSSGNSSDPAGLFPKKP